MKMRMLRMSYLMLPIVVMMWMAPLLGACSTGTMMKSGETHAGSSIRIGSGGGFSGIFSGYLFNADGTVYKWKIGPGEFEDTELLFTERDSVEQFFTLLDQVGFRSCEFNHPGNMTEFMELHKRDSLYTVQWGEPGVSPPQRIADLHRSMLSYAQRKSSSAP